MNRETKRLLQRQGQIDAEGNPQATARRAPAPAQRRVDVAKPPFTTRSRDYLHEVRQEIARVAWPTRAEVVRYSTVVIFTLILLVLLIWGLNYVFQHAVLKLYP